MTIARNIPQTTLPSSGVYPPDNSPATVPADVNQIIMTMTQVNWPLAGGVAFEYALEQSNDGGNTWALITGDTISDVDQSTSRTSINHQFKIGGEVTNVGSATRRVRIRWWNCKAGITVSGVLEVFKVDQTAAKAG